MTNERYHATPDQYKHQIEKSIQKALDEKRITPNDSKIIEKFISYLSKSEISPGRKFKLTSILVNVRRFFDEEYRAVDEDGLAVAIERIRGAAKPDGTPYTKNTKTDYLKTTKRFFLWMHKKGFTKIPLEEITDIKIGGYDMHTKSDDDVLSAEEINAIISAAKTPKYKAYFGVLYEAGARSIELANLQWKDVSFESWGVKVRLTDHKGGNTPVIRTTPIVSYGHYLSAWRAAYPGDPSGNNYVFITQAGEPLQYRGVQKALSLFVKNAVLKGDDGKETKITKKVSLHRFRHSRITHAIRGGMSETLAKRCFWGNAGTNMIQVYEHLTNNDIEKEVFRQAGIVFDESEKLNDAPEPIQCSQCHYTNPPGSRFCARCGMKLTAEAVKEYDDAIAFVENKFQNLSDSERFELMAELSKYK